MSTKNRLLIHGVYGSFTAGSVAPSSTEVLSSLLSPSMAARLATCTWHCVAAAWQNPNCWCWACCLVGETAGTEKKYHLLVHPGILMTSRKHTCPHVSKENGFRCLSSAADLYIYNIIYIYIIYIYIIYIYIYLYIIYLYIYIHLPATGLSLDASPTFAP